MRRISLTWILFFLSFIFFIFLVLYQYFQINTDERIDALHTCEQGRAAAQEEISNGQLGLILGGLGIDESFAGKMESYNIRIYRKGCLWTTGWDCYNSEMAIAIRTKFGNNILPEGIIVEGEIKLKQD